MKDKKIPVIGNGKLSLVIAGDYSQFKHFVQSFGQLIERKSYKFVNAPEKLRGYRPNEVKVVLWGDYWDNPAYKDIGYIKARKFEIIEL